MAIIDADGHVEESEAMFSLLEKEYYERRPLALALDKDTVYTPYNAVWLIDSKVYPKRFGKGGFGFATPTLMERAKQKPVAIPAQELTDVEARLRDLDRVGIDKQVIYPTLFLTTTVDDVKYEAALMRCYNNFLAHACAQSRGRLAFAALVPIRDSEESVRELQRAKGLGAVAAFLLGMAWDKTLGDPDLYPFYEAAADLDLPVVVHFGWGCPAITEVFDLANSFASATLPVLIGFRSIMAAGVMETFPKLRFAFLEAGSHWVPYLIHQLRRSGAVSRDPAEYFREGRVYVACEADEDITYLTQWIGEDALVVASDYPHGDASAEGDVVKAVMGREDVPLRVREKILSDNPERLYGI